MATYKTWIEIEVSVDYDYSPAEPTVLYPNEMAYPGAAESVRVNEVKHAYIDITDAICIAELERIEEEIMESLENNDER